MLKKKDSMYRLSQTTGTTLQPLKKLQYSERTFQKRFPAFGH